MFDWPVKSEDINKKISILEKELTKKDNELKQQNKVISKITNLLEEYGNKSKEVISKLEYVAEEAKKLETNLKRSKLKLAFVDKEIEDLNNNFELKKQKIFVFNQEKSKLRRKLNQLEFKSSKHSNFKKILKEIKVSLSLKGFLKKKDFENITKDIDTSQFFY